MSPEDKYKPGHLVVSCNGHDKGRYYLIIREEDDFLWLADGTYRPLDKVKKKRKKHVKYPFTGIIAMKKPEILLQSKKGSGDGDKAIREFIAQSIKSEEKERA